MYVIKELINHLSNNKKNEDSVLNLSNSSNSTKPQTLQTVFLAS